MTGAQIRDLPLIPRDSWRDRAACTPRFAERLWDDRLDGETDAQRLERHRQAKLVCNTECPVREECANDTDWETDEGIRGGHKLPSLDSQRSASEAEMLRLLRKGYTLDQAARRTPR